MQEQLEAILRCYAADLTRSEGDLKRALAGAALDDPGTWRLASAHGLLPSLYLLVSAHVPRSIPEAARTEFESQSNKSLAYARELPRIVEHLEQSGIQSIPIKGPLLAHTAFGNVFSRTPNDLDVIVRPDERDRAIEVLAKLGYRPKVARSRRADRRHRKRCYDYALVDSSGAVLLEVHDRLSAAGWPRMGVEDLFTRRSTAEFLGRTVPTLGAEDQIWYLSTHGSMHQWCRLEWLVSLAYEIVRVPDRDWESVLDLAKSAGALRATLIGLCLANRHLGALLAGVVHDAIGADLRVCSLAEKATHELRAGEARSVSNIAFNAAIRGSMVNRISYLGYVAAKVARRHRDQGAKSDVSPSLRRTLKRGAQLAIALKGSTNGRLR